MKEPISDQPDTIHIEKTILNFTRLVFEKSYSGIDSIVKLCAFPFYNKDWDGKRVYNSATELRGYLNETFKRENNKPVEYNVKTLFKSDSCDNIFLKSKEHICFKMTSDILNLGEGNYTAILKTTFYIENKFPFRILGVEQVY